MCQNTTMRINGAWVKRYCVLCSKTYNTLHSCHNFPAGSRQDARGARICETSLLDIGKIDTKNKYTYMQWNPSTKATQDGGLSKEVVCHEG